MHAKAREALSGDLSGLQSKNSAGMYGRWLTAVKYRSGSLGEAKDALDTLHENMADYDRIDQVELDCAKVWLNRQLGPWERMKGPKTGGRIKDAANCSVRSAETNPGFMLENLATKAKCSERIRIP